MAIVEKTPLELGPGDSVRYAERPLGVFTRPQGGRGWRDWLSTVDHKRIGILYGVSAMFFFLVGGVEALLIRLQLAAPEGSVLSADVYNQVYTMHGVTMVFLFIMPLAAAFSNYFIPLQIGARDVAFPRLNALSFWIWLSGAIFLNTSWMVGGGGADCGWFCYSTNSGVAFSPSHGVDFYAIGLQILGIASLVSSVNLIVTCLNMRAPGMTLMRMPVLTWMLLITQFLLLFALPVITVALFLLMFDRLFDAQFFNPDAGADPLLWQHLFWIFGHPEVYIIILPAFGVVSEVIPTFSRKPLFGYEFMVFSGIAIGFMGWGVWAHHMFVSGIGPISVAAFSLSTMFIAVPTGVKVLNWLATMWGGKLRFTVAMKFAVATVAMFTIGGLSGVTHSVAPADTQQTDTYYIVAHFHYVIFGGGVLGLFAGIYFWWPKIWGHFLNERLGNWSFWIMLVGFNLTFGPMHILGLQGMSRRIDTYARGLRLRVLEHGGHRRITADRGGGGDLHLERGEVQARRPPPAASGPGPLGRPNARMVDPVAGARAQLRHGAAGARPRRMVAHQVRRERRGQGGAGRHRRGGRPDRRGDRRAPAVAVLLAAGGGRRTAPDRLRPDLQPLARPDRRPADHCVAVLVGAGTGGRPRRRPRPPRRRPRRRQERRRPNRRSRLMNAAALTASCGERGGAESGRPASRAKPVPVVTNSVATPSLRDVP